MLRGRGWGTIALALVACALILGHGANRRLRALRAAAARAASKSAPPPPIPIEARPALARRPRILLDPPTLARLREAKKRDTPAWRRVHKSCDEALAKSIGGGYQGFDWADIVASLSVCWHATGEHRYADRALYYLQALLDDRFKVGDKQGGDDVVTHDTGYPIRTHASFTALAYDWLHDAPGMTPALRTRILARLAVWLHWYQTKGYLRDDPYANYFCGYLAAMSFAGLATTGEAPEGDRWLAFARDELLARLALPALKNQMRGGAWPEGWQYGEFSTVEIALIAKAFQTATGVTLAQKIPWLGEVVTHHVHQLLPPGHAVYDGGTWGDHPAHPSTTALRAITIALEGVDDARVAEARWLIHHAQPNWWGFEETWVALLAERPGAPERDPHLGAPLGLWLAGTGLGFWRSDWGAQAVWLSYQSGPRLTGDHQHNDQGHFELWRGADGLLIDAGDEEGDATINHNTLLVDDGGKHITYSPNQGVWGQAVPPARADDDGQVVVVGGDFAAAYTPACVEDGCVERSVHKALRTLVYVRPALAVVADRVVLDEKGFGVTWAAHTIAAPTVGEGVITVKVGGSRADLRLFEPEAARPSVLKEPTPTPAHIYRMNHTWAKTFRIEVASARGSRERRFLAWITAGPASAAAPPGERVRGTGLGGGRGFVGGRSVAVLFADDDGGGRIALPGGADLVVVAGLRPGLGYQVDVAPAERCLLTVRAAARGGQAASAAGALRISAAACKSH